MNLPVHHVNLNIQLIPIDHAANAYPVIDDVIALIASKGMKYTVGAFGTAVEGHYQALQQLVNDINALMMKMAVEEWVLNLQWHIKSGEAVSMDEKVTGR